MGISETKFCVRQGQGEETETHNWKIYTIHGSRTQRSAWVPFFDDGASACIFWSTRMHLPFTVDAILFLVPISSFDQRLVEDSRVCCLEDSIRQWREICRNRLLAHIDLMLCFNDLDLLQKKLESGIYFNQYLTQYKGPNTHVEVCRCEWSFPFPRPCHEH